MRNKLLVLFFVIVVLAGALSVTHGAQREDMPIPTPPAYVGG